MIKDGDTLDEDDIVVDEGVDDIETHLTFSMLAVENDMILLSSMDQSPTISKPIPPLPCLGCTMIWNFLVAWTIVYDAYIKQFLGRFICIVDVAIHQALINLGLKEVSSLSYDTLLYGFFIGFHGHSGFIFLYDQEWYLIMLDLKEYLISAKHCIKN